MALKTVYASKDASMLESNDGWSGWDNHHPVGISSSGNRYRSVIYFPISFTGMTAITNAKLWVRGHRGASGNHVLGASSGNSRNLNVYRVLADWGEGTDRGETLWSANEIWGWGNRAGSRAAAGMATRNFTGYAEGTWYDIDVTAIVRDYWFTGTANYGFMLCQDTDEFDSNKALEFYSRDAGASYKPYLEITYTSNVAPNAPVALSPTGDQLMNTLSPTLTGTRDDPDAGDYVSAYQILLYEDDGVTVKWDSGTITQTGTSSVFSKVYSGAGLSGNVFYKWKARTRDKDGAWGVYSALQRFKTNTPPNLPSIATSGDSSDLFTLTPGFYITHSDNDVGDSKMYGYRFIIRGPDGVAVWDSGDVDISGAPVTTHAFTYSGPVLSWQTTYTVEARTKDSNGVWSGFQYGWIKTHTTVTPDAGLTPHNETLSNLVPTFVGQRANANDNIVSYQIILLASDDVTQVWDSGTLTTNISSGASFSKLYTGSALAYGTTYKWKARITGSAGGTSAYSPLKIFTTPADATVPSLSQTPETAGRVTSLTPTLTGTRASAFTNYQIELYAGTATTANLGTPIWDSGNTAMASGTTFNKVYNGPALAWDTTYKWRARVGAPTLGSYGGLNSFTTDVAGAPTLTAPVADAWLTPVATNFTGTSFNSESIIAREIVIWNKTFTAVYYQSGLVAQTAATTFSSSVDLSTLPKGEDMYWSARYTKSTGPTGPFGSARILRVNSSPSIPTSLFPYPGYTTPNSLFPTFKAEFEDADEVARGDTPTIWEIEIRNNATDALIQTKSLTTGLTNGLNQYVWGTNTGGADTGLAFNTVYKWRTRFTDSKSSAGAWSSYSTFFNGQPPVISTILPSNGSNIATTSPTVSWTYSDPNGRAQAGFHIYVYRSSNGVLVYKREGVTSSVPSIKIPAGYIPSINNETFVIYVIVWNTDGLSSNTLSSTVQLLLNAPPPIESLSATVIDDKSLVFLNWDSSSLGTAFVTYVIYRRPVGEIEWTMIGTSKPESASQFNEWYAGNGVLYEYRVTVVKLIANEPDIESPDSDIVTVNMDSDVWMVVGNDRSDEHIFELPVSGESHSRPVQQETFEPLGSNRKAVVRGFVLGHEGSIDISFDQSESRDAKAKVEYLLYYAGPHILKNPFGDVFDVTFGSPDYQYSSGGHLDTTLTWIEVGSTNNPGLSPDEFLRQIGAI